VCGTILNSPRKIIELLSGEVLAKGCVVPHTTYNMLSPILPFMRALPLRAVLILE